jgi:hypothetical protein
MAAKRRCGCGDGGGGGRRGLGDAAAAAAAALGREEETLDEGAGLYRRDDFSVRARGDDNWADRG